MNKSHLFQFGIIGLLLTGFVSLTGCGSSDDYLQDAAELMDSQQTGDGSESSLLGAVKQLASRGDDQTASDALGLFDEVDANRSSEALNFPSPNRTDPFRWESDSSSEARPTFSRSAVSVLGFAGLETTKVLLSVDGHASLLEAGDEIDGLRVEEITPPTAKVTYNGVTWRASLFDERGSNTQ